MTEFELLGRIADLETALRLLAFFAIVAIVVLAKLPSGDCDPKCERCSIYKHTSICPMCFQRHDRKERCG